MSGRDTKASRFIRGDRVRVAKGTLHGPAFLQGKSGTMTSVGPLMPLMEVEGALRPEDRQYVVDFDDQDRKLLVWES